jgi:hypothetical protein
MKLIAHRGNINGPNPEQENQPEYIKDTLNQGYDCEIDVRYINNQLYLGHDHPDYLISLDFLITNSDKFWIHCKNIDALDYLIQFNQLNIFWHQEDQYTLTSKGFIWAYPNMRTTSKCIILMPEWNNFVFDKTGYGICSDYCVKLT